MSAIPSPMASWSHRLRSCSAIGMREPSGAVRARWRACTSSIRASRPVTSLSPGSASCSARPRRMASCASSRRSSSVPDVAAYPSLKIRYSTRRTAASRPGSWPDGGRANGTPLSLIDCFARLIRRVTVSGAASRARAISAVLRPPTARRVRAIWDAAGSDGWQHMMNSTRVSSVSAGLRSPAGAGPGSAMAHWATVSSRRRRAWSARSRSVSRRAATAISQPLGLSGSPSRGHCRAAASSASWVASSARSKWPKRRTTAPRTCGASRRSRSSASAAATGAVLPL